MILSDDLGVSWADAKSIEKMILRSLKQPDLLRVNQQRTATTASFWLLCADICHLY
jgi:hypothetical protein